MKKTSLCSEMENLAGIGKKNLFKKIGREPPAG
jgi:hypothetical protein